MDDLIAFVRARLDEDEAAAKAAFRSVLEADGFHIRAPAHPGVPPLPVADAIDAETAEHIARHDPARVLREVAAKRAILAMYEDCDGYDLPEGVHDGRDPDERECDAAAKAALGDVLEVVARTWSDHPAYLAGWKPEQ